MIMADDIGWFNVSAYNHGVMGYRTPNIDRIAKEGAMFTDWYGEQSCTAGRAAFVTGQSPLRRGPQFERCGTQLTPIFSVMPTSPGMPPGKSTIRNLILYPP